VLETFVNVLMDLVSRKSGRAKFLYKHQNIFNVFSGMSEIRDRAKAAPAKSQKFRDNGLPVSG
jgi:hypothetical protein